MSNPTPEVETLGRVVGPTRWLSWSRPLRACQPIATHRLDRLRAEVTRALTTVFGSSHDVKGLEHHARQRREGQARRETDKEEQ